MNWNQSLITGQRFPRKKPSEKTSEGFTYNFCLPDLYQHYFINLACSAMTGKQLSVELQIWI